MSWLGRFSIGTKGFYKLSFFLKIFVTYIILAVSCLPALRVRRPETRLTVSWALHQKIHKVTYWYVMSRSSYNIALWIICFLLVFCKSFFQNEIKQLYHGWYKDLLTFTSSARCSTLRVARAETRLTVYRSSYIVRVRSYLAFLFPPRFLVKIDKSCIVASTIITLMSLISLSRFKIVSK